MSPTFCEKAVPAEPYIMRIVSVQNVPSMNFGGTLFFYLKARRAINPGLFSASHLQYYMGIGITRETYRIESSEALSDVIFNHYTALALSYS